MYRVCCGSLVRRAINVRMYNDFSRISGLDLEAIMRDLCLVEQMVYVQIV